MGEGRELSGRVFLWWWRGQLKDDVSLLSGLFSWRTLEIKQLQSRLVMDGRVLEVGKTFCRHILRMAFGGRRVSTSTHLLYVMHLCHMASP